jgi:hypothetical protein
MICQKNLFCLLYANSLDAFVPELWAQESLAILEENMVAGMLVHRDFEPTIAKFGDVVNTRQPAAFTATRKGVDDDVTIQNATATNVPVTLNQLVHTSFLIRDGEESKSFKNLVAEYLRPAIVAQARFVDLVVLGQYPQFLANTVGKLGELTSTTAKQYILDARKKMNVNKAFEQNRHLIWTPNAEAEVLKLDLFLSADKIGDDGTAMREASLGRKLQFNHWMCQNMGSVASTAVDTVVGAVNNGDGYPAGTTTMTVDALTAAITVGTFITVAGDDNPLRVVSTVGGATPTSITVASPGLRNAVVNDAVITIYDPGTVNYTADYDSGYDGAITVDGFTNTPVAGQMVSFGASATAALYTIISATATTITLDRPLEDDLADGAAVNVGPPGEFNLGFHPNAIALVVRPLAAPQAGTGALSQVVSYNGLSMRATITYNGTKQGHLVTLDMLMGIKVLNSSLGTVLLG